MAAIRNGRLFAFAQHIPSATPRTILLRQFWPAAAPPLDATDLQLIDKIRRTGRIECGSLSDAASSAYSQGNACDMRTAERISRNAYRKQSAWFNDAMLEYWRAKWKREDKVRAAIERELEKQRVETDNARRKRLAEETEAMAEHNRWVAAEQKKRNRWIEEEREESERERERQATKEEEKKLERIRESIKRENDRRLRGCPRPAEGHVIFWAGFVVVRESDGLLIPDFLKEELREAARYDGLLFYYPTPDAIRLIWPEGKT